MCEIYEDNSNVFQDELNTFIEEEIQKRVKEKIEDFDDVISNYKKSQLRLSELNSEVNHLKIDLKTSREKALKEGLDQAQREILGGFKVDDKVWFVHRNSTWVDCGTCVGKSKVKVKFENRDIEVKCPDCSSGRNHKYSPIIKQGVITEIHYQVWFHGEQVKRKFYVDFRGNSSAEFHNTENMFRTEEECEAYLKNING